MNWKAASLFFCSLILGSLIADGGATASEVEDAVVSLKAAFARPIPPELFGKGDRTRRRSTVLSFTGNSRKFAYSAKSTSRTYSKATNSEMTLPVVIVRTSEALFSDLKGVTREESAFMARLWASKR